MPRMKKDFDTWNEEKKRADANEEYLPLYQEREVRWCRLGVNVGFEQDGTGKDFSRPVLILKGFSRRVCLVIPLTTSNKSNKYHIAIGEVGGRKATAIISQLRLIDTRRLDQHIATIDKEIFKTIRKTVKAML
jgi:mRNA interferase MazF